jgi:FAD/FMN-containing dehydrogenase
MMFSSALLEKFATIVGPSGVLRTDIDAYMKELRGRVTGKSPCVLLPQNTEQVAAIVKLCVENKIPLVPQSGNTGLVGANVPTADGDMVTLSLKRMNTMRALDADDFSMVAEAGCILQTTKDIAAGKNRLLAMTLASEGSAMIGGLIAANAGGSYTLRYGNMREQVLGIEAVMADGSIYSDLRSLRKNNSGYDIKQLLIGSEGTLGVITAATLKLYPIPKTEAAMIALPNIEAAIKALGILREATGDRLAAFEMMPRLAIESAIKHIPNQRDPFIQPAPWVAMIETHEASGSSAMESALAQLISKNIAGNAVLAQNEAQIKSFWALREAVVEAQKHLGASLKHDLSVPVGRIAEFITKGTALVEKAIPGIRVYAFGHVGDGNIHFNLSAPEGMAADAFTAQREAIASKLHDLVLSLGGAISAEHGIGRFKREEFLRTAPPEQIEAMRKIKRALDPHNIFNPGVIV